MLPPEWRRGGGGGLRGQRGRSGVGVREAGLENRHTGLCPPPLYPSKTGAEGEDFQEVGQFPGGSVVRTPPFHC